MNKIDIIEAMFRNVFEAIDPVSIPQYFAPDFRIETNNTLMNYQEFMNHVIELTHTHQKVKFHFPLEDCFVSADNTKVVTRYTIETDWKSGRHDKLTVIAIYQFKADKIAKWWELVQLANS